MNQEENNFTHGAFFMKMTKFQRISRFFQNSGFDS